MSLINLFQTNQSNPMTEFFSNIKAIIILVIIIVILVIGFTIYKDLRPSKT